MPEEWEHELAELLQLTLRLHAELCETRDVPLRRLISARLEVTDRRIDDLCARSIPRKAAPRYVRRAS